MALCLCMLLVASSAGAPRQLWAVRRRACAALLRCCRLLGCCSPACGRSWLRSTHSSCQQPPSIEFSAPACYAPACSEHEDKGMDCLEQFKEFQASPGSAGCLGMPIGNLLNA